MSTERIFQGVTEVLVKALNVDSSEITPETTLSGDLGAESIDYLDIIFRLENKFNISIPRGDLFPMKFIPPDPDPSLISNGSLTTLGLEQLQKQMPYADLSQLKKDPKLSNFLDLFTVNFLCRYIASKLGTTV
jgi:acyl carrier protein